MAKPKIDVDEVVKQLASESVKQGENLRAAVRGLTLEALQTRELSLSEMKQVLGSVTEGVSLGAANAGIDVEKALTDAVAGMDDALLKAVQASQIALQLLTDHGTDFKGSLLKTALDELETLEDEFLKTVRQTAEGASAPVRAQWASVLQHMPLGSTETGAQVAATMQELSDRMQAAMRGQRAANVKAAHMLAQNFGTLASGVLIGMSEALQPKSAAPKGKKGQSAR